MRLVIVNRLPGELKGAHVYSYLGSAAISILQAFGTTVEDRDGSKQLWGN